MEKLTLGRLFLDRAQKLGSNVAVRFKEGAGAYQSMSWQDFRTVVQETGFGLAASGFKPDHAVWYSVSNLASVGCGGFRHHMQWRFSVPLYPN